MLHQSPKTTSHWYVCALCLLLPGIAGATNVTGPGPQRYVTHANPKHQVIFLHGLGGSPQSLVAHELYNAFQRRGDRMEIKVPWLRPVHPQDLTDAGPHTMTDQLARIKHQMNSTPGKVVLLGHSFGTKAALKLAKECPDKVSCVVGLAPSVSMFYSYWKRVTGERGVPGDSAAVVRRLDQHKTDLQGQLQRARRSLRLGRVEMLKGELGYLEVMKDLATHNEPGLERGVRSPTMIIHGGQDQAVSIHYVRRFAGSAQNPGVELVEHPTADHHFQVLRGNRVDRRATRQVVDQMAETISNFIGLHDRVE